MSAKAVQCSRASAEQPGTSTSTSKCRWGDLRALLRDGGLTGQLAKPAASRWLIDPAHSTAFDTLRCSPVIIACSAVPVRYSVAAIVVSFTERGQNFDRQLL